MFLRDGMELTDHGYLLKILQGIIFDLLLKKNQMNLFS